MVYGIVVSSLESGIRNIGPGKKSLDTHRRHIPKPYKSTWYLTPRRHAIELLVFLTIAFPVFIFLIDKAAHEPSWIHHPPIRSSTPLDILAGAASLLGVIGTLYYKVHSTAGWRLPFALQPCHVLSLALCFTAWSNSPAANAVFQIYVTLTWSSVLAFIFPDMSDYEFYLDKVNYWWEHSVMLVVPIYFIKSGRYVLMDGMYWITLGYVVIVTYHFVILELVALVSEVNVSTVMSPPVGKDVGGVHYRPIFAVALFVMHMVYNLILFNV